MRVPISVQLVPRGYTKPDVGLVEPPPPLPPLLPIASKEYSPNVSDNGIKIVFNVAGASGLGVPSDVPKLYRDSVSAASINNGVIVGGESGSGVSRDAPNE